MKINEINHPNEYEKAFMDQEWQIPSVQFLMACVFSLKIYFTCGL